MVSRRCDCIRGRKSADSARLDGRQISIDRRSVPDDAPTRPNISGKVLDSISLFGQRGPTTTGTPTWLLEHFSSSVVDLHGYEPKAMTPSQAPKTFAI